MKSWWKSLNADQRKLLSSADVFRDYITESWRGIIYGALTAVLLYLAIRVAEVDPLLKTWADTSNSYKYVRESPSRFYDLSGFLQFLFVLLFAAMLPSVIALVAKLIRSWLVGICRLTPVAIFAILLAKYYWHWFTGLQAAGAVSILIFMDLVPFYAAQLRYLQSLKPQAVLKNTRSVRIRNRRRRSTDDPISEWSQDQLDRSSIIDTLKVKILVGEAPVIALRGRFGTGKTSTLNLLRRDLLADAIVVSFSTWLPGSEATLTSDLLRDVSRECRKKYYLPGLGRALVKYSRVLSADVPYLRGIHELFSPPTQSQELHHLKEMLEKLPKRIVILLDEVDRMRKKELLTLLKLIRGMGAIPNLTFVCAFDREQVEKTVCKTFDEASHEYFEKFFPNAIDLPEIDGLLLKKEFLDTAENSIFTEGWS